MEERYRHTPEMGEISGFGGGYEECCQDMLEAGVKWLLEHPNATLSVLECKEIYGVVKTNSPDADALSKVVIEASKGDATGAMHHSVMGRLCFINQEGWPAYCNKSVENESQQKSQEQQDSN